MSEYFPDRWVIIKMEGKAVGKPFYRIMASWYGGYCGSDSWKLSSGIESISYDPVKEVYTSPQTSGSVYKLHKQSYGMSGYTSSVYHNYESQNSDEIRISVMDENFDIASALQL
jgi:hypothetical protein